MSAVSVAEARDRPRIGYGHRLRRHRLFETNWPALSAGCKCGTVPLPVLDVSGGGPSRAPRLDGGGGRTYKGTADEARGIMGTPWATKAECNEAIPPAYTEHIGRQLLAYISDAAQGVAPTNPLASGGASGGAAETNTGRNEA